MVESTELSQIVTWNSSSLCVFWLQKFHEFVHILEVVKLKALNIFLPEILTVTRTPSQSVCVDLFYVLLKAWKYPVVLLQDIFQSVEIFP